MYTSYREISQFRFIYSNVQFYRCPPSNNKNNMGKKKHDDIRGIDRADGV